MNLLTIDTASPLLSVALHVDGKISCRSSRRRNWAEELVEQIRELLQEHDLAVADLDAIGAVRGPGSFTGVRIGLAITLGLHQSLRIPAGAFSTHDVLDQVALEEQECCPNWLSAVDAHRGNWFVRRAEQSNHSAGPQLQNPDSHSYRIDLLGAAELVAIAHAGEPVVGHDLPFDSPTPCPPLAPPLATLMARFLAAGGQLDPRTLSSPLYLQQPQLVTQAQAEAARASRR